jgi:hypothetical protein
MVGALYHRKKNPGNPGFFFRSYLRFFVLFFFFAAFLVVFLTARFFLAIGVVEFLL